MYFLLPKYLVTKSHTFLLSKIWSQNLIQFATNCILLPKNLVSKSYTFCFQIPFTTKILVPEMSYFLLPSTFCNQIFWSPKNNFGSYWGQTSSPRNIITGSSRPLNQWTTNHEPRLIKCSQIFGLSPMNNYHSQEEWQTMNDRLWPFGLSSLKAC